ncbi:hypothetical protein WBG78_18455 [Chryseolinea sp. T2]|uniref:hypothetical protein n=1 Tax=Chryseolinea sp. T2 TaxID=3129255 RepID=UPI00307887D5
MKKSLIVLVAFCACGSLSAQTSEEFMVRTGQEASEVIPRVKHFYYPTFQQGQVFYPQGKRSDVMLLNYNTLLEVMQYIDQNGDTLYIPEESNIFRYIRIGKDLFYHHFRDGYFNLQTREDNYNLATRTRWKIERRDIMVYNGYGMATVSPGSTVSTRRVGESVVNNEDMAYRTQTEFYIVGPRDAVFHATRAGVLKAFSEYKSEILEYLRDHQTNFEDPESLRDLVQYSNTLVAAQNSSATYKPSGN